MAIISGYQPAQQPELMQPWQLPFNEMYTALKDKQTDADLQAQRADELMITLGSIQNLLPKDLITHKEKMDNLVKSEELLRSQVGEDITRPEYKQGLRKLIVSTATDPFYSIGMQNYQTVEEQDKIRQAMMAAGTYEGKWQESGTYNPETYTGAIGPNGTLNKLEPGQFNPTDTFIPDIMKLAKEIIPQEFAGYQYNDKTGFWENYEGKKLPKGEIVRVLKENKDAWASTSNYTWFKNKWKFHNPTGTEADFEGYLDDILGGAADIYDVNNYGASMIPGQLRTPSSGGGSGDEETKVKYPNVLGLPVTVGDYSNSFETPEDLTEYTTRQSKKINKLKPANKQEAEQNIWWRQDGIHALESNLAKQGNFSSVKIEPAYDADNERLDFTINALDANGNAINIEPGSKLYKDNYQTIMNLKAEYEAAEINIDRAMEFDAEARKASGFTPDKEAAAKQVTGEIKNKSLSDLVGNLDIHMKMGRIKLKPGQSISDLEWAVLQGHNKVNGKPITLSEQEKLDIASDVMKRIEFNKPIAIRVGSNNATIGEAASPEEYIAKAEEYLVNNEYKDKLGKIGYTEYKDYYKNSFGEGSYLINSKNFSFGTSGEQLKYKEEILGSLVARISNVNIPVYDPQTGEEYEPKIRKELAESTVSKAQEGKLRIEDAKWRVDSNEGIVIDYTIDGKVVEIRDLSGVMEYLAANNLQDYSVLKLMDEAAKTTVRSDAEQGEGKGSQWGYFGDDGSFPKMMFKINVTPVKKNGRTYPEGSIELRVPQPDGSTKSEFFDNMYDATVEGYLKLNAEAQTMVNDLSLFEAVIGQGERSASGSVSPSGNHFGVSQVSKDVINAYNVYTDSNFAYEAVKNNDDLNKQIGNWYLNERIPEILASNGVPATPITKVISYNAGPGNATKWWSKFGGELSPASIQYLKDMKTVVGGKTTDTVYDYLVRVGLIIE